MKLYLALVCAVLSVAACKQSPTERYEQGRQSLNTITAAFAAIRDSHSTGDEASLGTDGKLKELLLAYKWGSNTEALTKASQMLLDIRSRQLMGEPIPDADREKLLHVLDENLEQIQWVSDHADTSGESATTRLQLRRCEPLLRSVRAFVASL